MADCLDMTGIGAMMWMTCMMKSPRVSHHPLQVAVLALVLLPQVVAAQYVELTATLETLRWGANGMRVEEPAELRCTVGTNSWRIDGRFFKDAKSSAWFTGTNIIQNDELATPVAPNQRLIDYTDGNGRFVQVATSSGQRWTKFSESLDGNPGRPIRKGDLLTIEGRIVWLAFCSGPCLKREGRKLYPPHDLWKGLVNAPNGFSDRTAVFEDGLGLPKSIRIEVPNHSPILEYGILGSTNVCGWEFPLEFVLTQYRPAWQPDRQQFGPDGWEVDFVVRGRVVTIGVAAKPEIPTEVTAALKK